MLVIRLRRMGSSKRPFFRVVVTDSRAPRDTRVVDEIGYYDPRTNPETFRVDPQRLDDWLKRGAQASGTVRTLVARQRERAAAAAGAPQEQATS